MLQKKNRFHGHNSVSKVRGKKFRGEGFSVYAAKTKRDDFRMAVVVSKKQHLVLSFVIESEEGSTKRFASKTHYRTSQ